MILQPQKSDWARREDLVKRLPPRFACLNGVLSNLSHSPQGENLPLLLKGKRQLLVSVFKKLSAPVKIAIECWVGVSQKAIEIVRETLVRRNAGSSLEGQILGHEMLQILHLPNYLRSGLSSRNLGSWVHLKPASLLVLTYKY